MSGIPVAFEFGRVVFRAVSLNWPGSVRAHPDGSAKTEERSERAASERASIFVSGEGWCADAKVQLCLANLYRGPGMSSGCCNL
jgi:hypothetical protein